MTHNGASNYYEQSWEARVSSQAREECAQLVAFRLDALLRAAQLGPPALRSAVQQLVAELRAGVLVGSQRGRQPLCSGPSPHEQSPEPTHPPQTHNGVPVWKR